MEKLKKNDIVEIKGTDDIWDGRTGTVVEQGEETITKDGEDITDVTVKVTFKADDKDKTVTQIFPRNVLKIKSENESLNEAYDKPKSKKDFINLLIGKHCIFNGFDYSEIYNQHENANGELEYSPEDLSDIRYFKSFEGKEFEITDCAIDAGYDEDKSFDDNFKACYWNIRCLENDEELDNVSGEFLTLMNIKINEEKEQEGNKDFIHDYIYITDIDDKEVPSWMFADRIATAEDIDVECVLEAAKKNNYNMFAVEAPGFYKEAIAAKGIKADDIYDDYADYLQGSAYVYPLK